MATKTDESTQVSPAGAKEPNARADQSASTPIVDNSTADRIVSDVIEQRRASLLYFNQNYYEEWAETYRTMKARVTPIKVKNAKGEEEEDHTRTNVCLPDHHVMLRRGVARLTRNHPTLRVRGGSSQEQRDTVSAMLAHQWDRSNAQPSFRAVVKCCKALGWGVAKSYWDKVTVERKFRRRTSSLKMHEILRLQGASQDEIDDAERNPNDPPSAQIISGMTAEHGDEVVVPTEVTKYSGPMLDAVFIGDIFPEPGFQSINRSAYVTENTMRDENWLKYWAEQVTTDPETGKEIPVMDPYRLKQLEDIAPREYTDPKAIDLRRMMREEIEIIDPRIGTRPQNLPVKRYVIDERHSVQNGALRVDYVAEESILIGQQWYPFDTYGRYLYSELILIPDLIEGIGDSPARITRFLMQMRNARMNQSTDFINNKLLPMLKVLEGQDVTEQALTRTGWGRVLRVRDMNTIVPLIDPPYPAEAFQDQAMLVREMQQVAPETADYSSGTQAVPEPGKLATTAKLQQMASDNVLADELEQVNIFIRDTVDIWLAMDQQLLEEPLKIDLSHLPQALSLRGGNNAGSSREITIDPLDIQEEFDVVPEAGSTLADDDDYKTQSVQQGFLLAAAHPDVFNKMAFGKRLAETIPGMTVEEAMAPPPPPPPPMEGIKVSLSVAAKFEDLATDVKVAILGAANLPTAGTQAEAPVKIAQHVAKAVKGVSDAAEAATNLARPATDVGGEAGPPGSNGRIFGAPIGVSQGNGARNGNV